MIKYGNSAVPVIKIPKGTLLFRAVEDQQSDFKGVENCFPPQYNVFFYFAPFVVDGIHWYDFIPDMQVYVATQEIRVVSLISPSKYTRGSRLNKTQKQFMVSCSKTRKACLKPRPYDPCFRESFLKKNPDILGWVAIGHKDIVSYADAVKQGKIGEGAKYVRTVRDARKLEGPPELAIYPLKERATEDIAPPTDLSLFNYAHVATIPRGGRALIKFMEEHAEPVPGKWYYAYKG
jgi:hypothetical protein